MESIGLRRMYAITTGLPEQFPAWIFLLYRVQTRRNLFQWLSLDFLQFLVPASFSTSTCYRRADAGGCLKKSEFPREHRKNGSIRGLRRPAERIFHKCTTSSGLCLDGDPIQ